MIKLHHDTVNGNAWVLQVSLWRVVLVWRFDVEFVSFGFSGRICLPSCKSCKERRRMRLDQTATHKKP